MSKDYFPEELTIRAHELAKEYIQKDFMDGEACAEFVREFISRIAVMAPRAVSEDIHPIEVALNALVFAKVFELALLKGYGYAAKKVQAIESLKNAFDS